MKKAMFFAIIGFLAAVLLPVSSATAAVVDIIVPDAGFEDTPTRGPGQYIYVGDYTGPWQSELSGGAYIHSTYYDGGLPAHSGNHKVTTSDYYGNTAYFDQVYQILDETFIEGATYTLSVWVGNAWPEQGYVDDWALYFTGEDYTINLAEAHGLALLPDWEQISLEYTATAADAGKKIGIKMSGAVGESYIAFDDVTLSYAVDPGLASNANPLNEQTDVHHDAVLSWEPAELSAATNGQVV